MLAETYSDGQRDKALRLNLLAREAIKQRGKNALIFISGSDLDAIN